MLNLKTIVKVIRLYFYWLLNAWKITYITKEEDNNKNHLLIVPCDPWTGIGSRGDEAMILSTIQYFKEKSSAIKVSLVMAPDERNKDLDLPGVDVYYCWEKNVLKNVLELFFNLKPANLVVLGADCMDGFYSPIVSLCLLSICDLSIRSNILTTLLGFSFNNNPSKLLYPAYRICTAKLKFHLRDVISKERFEKFTGRKATLVADAAFLMKSNRGGADMLLLDWIKNRKNNQELIVGINVHPMLLDSASKESVDSFSFNVAKRLIDILNEHPNVFYLLLPHDNRTNVSDLVCLSIIADFLVSNGQGERFYFMREVLHAPEIKQICADLDVLITSRMHLAIAALGVGVPIMAITYQGKFAGLFKHFDLDLSYLLEPNQLEDSSFNVIFQRFIYERKNIASTVEDHLLQVREKALNNFV